MGIIQQVSDFSERWSALREPLTNGVLSAHAGNAKLTAQCGGKDVEIGFEMYEREVHVSFFRINDMVMQFNFMPKLESWESEILSPFFPPLPCSPAEVEEEVEEDDDTICVRCDCGRRIKIQLTIEEG